MEWFSTWWNDLELVQQILYCIALPSSLLLVIQAILIIIGVGGDADSGGFDADGADVDFSGDSVDSGDFHTSHDFGVASMFTLQGVCSFLSVFGWMSLFLHRSGVMLIFSLIGAGATGFVVMFLFAKLMFYVTRLAHSGTLEVKNLLGCMGTVYLKIPPKGKGKGKVIIQTSERLVEFDAVNESQDDIPNNAHVRVIDILGENVLVVEKQ